MTKRALVSGIVLGVAAVGQVVLAFVLYRQDANALLRNLSWAVLWISAILGWWPILGLRLRGTVANGLAPRRCQGGANAPLHPPRQIEQLGYLMSNTTESCTVTLNSPASTGT